MSKQIILITGGALTEKGLALAQQIAGKTGCKVMGQTYHPRMARGRGRFSIDRIPYVIEQALPLKKWSSGSRRTKNAAATHGPPSRSRWNWPKRCSRIAAKQTARWWIV